MCCHTFHILAAQTFHARVHLNKTTCRVKVSNTILQNGRGKILCTEFCSLYTYFDLVVWFWEHFTNLFASMKRLERFTPNLVASSDHGVNVQLL